MVDVGTWCEGKDMYAGSLIFVLVFVKRVEDRWKAAKIVWCKSLIEWMVKQGRKSMLVSVPRKIIPYFVRGLSMWEFLNVC